MVDVWVAPGHGMRSNGTYDPGAMDGDKSEQNEGNKVAGFVTNFLKDLGLSVYRQPMGGPNFVGSIDDINRQNPKLAIELHHDWIKAPHGGFGFYIHDKHLKLANLIHDEYKSSGLPTRPHLKYLPGTTLPPAIMSRTKPFTILWEINRIGSVSNHAMYGAAIAKGIAKYLGIPLVPVVKPKPIVVKPDPIVTPEPIGPLPVIEEPTVVDKLVRKRVNESVRLSEAAAAGSISQIRRDFGMPPDTHSDIIHVKRIREGEHLGKSYDITTVFDRLSKASKAHGSGASLSECRSIEGTEED